MKFMTEMTTSLWRRAKTLAPIGAAIATVIAFVLVAATVHEAVAPSAVPASPPKQNGALWTRACDRSPAGAEVCFVEQFAIAEPQRAVMLRVQIGFMGPGGKPRMIISTPSGVWLPGGLTLTLDQSKPLALPFDTCGSDGCVAMVELGQDALARFTGGRILTVRYLQGGNSPIDIPVRLADLAAALDTFSPK
jgi:invasion protein IalB